MKVNTLQLKRVVSTVLFVLLLSAAGMTKAFAQSFTVGKLNYSVNDDGATVTVTGHVNGTGATGELVIPETVTYNESTYSVTTIGYGAFSYCAGFTGNLVIPNSVDTIVTQAFCNCTGFSSVEYNATNCADVQLWDEYAPFYFCTGQLIIGENVERIPANMFKWSAFSQILSHAEMPPTVGTDAFYGIDHEIPVYVPCGSYSDYKNTEGWNEFNNIFNNCLEITALVIPANSGSVTGTGTYEMGTTCTLIAIANEGYTFLYWIENETVVSTDATYSFVVTEDRNLVAGFIVPGSLGDVNDDHVVNVADVQAVASYMYGYYLPTFNVINADANQDGVINIGDIQAILMIIQNNHPDN